MNQMSGLKAGRPSANKSKLSVTDMDSQERLKRISFDMTETQHRELKKYAAEHGVTIREVLNGLIDTLLKQGKK